LFRLAADSDHPLRVGAEVILKILQKEGELC
jgi:hypothetical protein